MPDETKSHHKTRDAVLDLVLNSTAGYYIENLV